MPPPVIRGTILSRLGSADQPADWLLMGKAGSGVAIVSCPFADSDVVIEFIQSADATFNTFQDIPDLGDVVIPAGSVNFTLVLPFTYSLPWLSVDWSNDGSPNNALTITIIEGLLHIENLGQIPGS